MIYFPPLFFSSSKSKSKSKLKQYTRYLKDNVRDQKKRVNTPTFCVIGSGFSGLSMCGALKRWGIPFECFEASDGVGGNWYHGGIFFFEIFENYFKSKFILISFF